MTRPVELHGRAAAGRQAVIDDADAGLAARFRFHVWARPGRAYVVTTLAGRKVALHTLITGWPRVAHRDGDPFNLTRANLAPVTHADHPRAWWAAVPPEQRRAAMRRLRAIQLSRDGEAA